MNTRAAYERDLASFAEWCGEQGRSPLDADVSDLDLYRNTCEADGVGTATLARRLSAVSSFYRHAVADGAVATNPVDGIERGGGEPSPPQHGLDDAEAEAVLDAAASLGPKAAVLVHLLLLDGMKLGEALSLDVADLSGSGPTMTATVTRRRERKAVPLDASTVRAIATYLDGRDAGPLLVGDSPTRAAGGRLTRFGADFLLKQVARLAGLSRVVSANTLRRTYISRALRNGVPLVQIQRHVGHVEARGTRRYVE